MAPAFVVIGGCGNQSASFSTTFETGENADRALTFAALFFHTARGQASDNIFGFQNMSANRHQGSPNRLSFLTKLVAKSGFESGHKMIEIRDF